MTTTLTASKANSTVETIVQAITKVTGSTKDQWCVNSRARPFIFYRQIAHYIARYNSELTVVRIGEVFGALDHSSVSHSCKTIENEIDFVAKTGKTTWLFNLLKDIEFEYQQLREEQQNLSTGVTINYVLV